MSSAGCNETLAVLIKAPRESYRGLTAICAALDAGKPNGPCTPWRRLVIQSLGKLAKRGLVETTTLCGFGKADTSYRLTLAGRAFVKRGDRIGGGAPKGKVNRPAGRSNTFRERLWKALRVKVRGTIPDLVEAARNDSDTADTNAINNNAYRFLKALTRAEIVFAQGAMNRRQRAPGFAPSSNGFITWRLQRDLGPKAPVPHKAFVYDPNEPQRIAYVAKEAADETR